MVNFFHFIYLFFFKYSITYVYLSSGLNVHARLYRYPLIPYTNFSPSCSEVMFGADRAFWRKKKRKKKEKGSRGTMGNILEIIVWIWDHFFQDVCVYLHIPELTQERRIQGTTFQMNWIAMKTTFPVQLFLRTFYEHNCFETRLKNEAQLF